MKTSEIAPLSPAILETEVDGKQHLLRTEVLAGAEWGLLVKRIQENGVDIETHQESQVTVRNRGDNRIYVFAVQSVTPTNSDYGVVHVLKIEAVATIQSLRKAERVDMLSKGEVITPKGKFNVVIYDLSVRGISMIIGDKSICAVGDVLSVSFYVGQDFHKYEAQAEVVRFFQVKGKDAIGCRLRGMPVDVIGLVDRKKAELSKVIQEKKES